MCSKWVRAQVASYPSLDEPELLQMLFAVGFDLAVDVSNIESLNALLTRLVKTIVVNTHRLDFKSLSLPDSLFPSIGAIQLCGRVLRNRLLRMLLPVALCQSTANAESGGRRKRANLESRRVVHGDVL